LECFNCLLSSGIFLNFSSSEQVMGYRILLPNLLGLVIIRISWRSVFCYRNPRAFVLRGTEGLARSVSFYVGRDNPG